jgi:RNA polymerase sigma factor (sigma-70 family)
LTLRSICARSVETIQSEYEPPDDRDWVYEDLSEWVYDTVTDGASRAGKRDERRRDWFPADQPTLERLDAAENGRLTIKTVYTYSTDQLTQLIAAEEAAEEAAELERFWERLKTLLTPTQYEIAWAFIYEHECDQVEIARARGCKPANICQHLKRIRAKLTKAGFPARVVCVFEKNKKTSPRSKKSKLSCHVTLRVYPDASPSPSAA